MRDFRKLKVYQEAMGVVVQVYKFTQELPEAEKFGLKSQLQRAVVSIASNIAEGARGSNKDFTRFLKYSLGSANEIECQLDICHRIYHISSPNHLEESIRILQAKIVALIKSLNRTTTHS